MGRRLVIALTTLSLVLFATMSALRARSKTTTDVVMVALSGGRCLLVNSHEGQWVEMSALSGWTDRGVAWWSANRNYPTTTSPRAGNHSWNRAGPFLFWQRHTLTQQGGLTFVHGTLVVPTDDGGRLPAYGDAYARADAANAWAGVLPNQPGWLFLNGWEIRLPHTYLVVLAGLMPLVVMPVWLMRAVRRFRRPRAGLCPGCGYDLRASPDRCPECGRPSSPATAPAGTAPAVTAP